MSNVYQGTLAAASNRADWIVTIDATDNNTGDPVDWTTASAIVISVRKDGSELLNGSLANGKVTGDAAGRLEWHFTSSDMSLLAAGTYDVGVAYQVGSAVTTLLVATLSVIEGVAQL